MRKHVVALVGLCGCVSQAECERRINVAVNLGQEHGRVCELDVAALEDLDCGGSDQRPELRYYAAFCLVADVDTCLRADEELFGFCIGTP
jgi:hypothetical protein